MFFFFVLSTKFILLISGRIFGLTCFAERAVEPKLRDRISEKCLAEPWDRPEYVLRAIKVELKILLS